jgi:C-terminal processing protease CtpA/Prc
VAEVLPNSSTAKSGKVACGDQLLTVDGDEVRGLDLDSVGAKLSGAKGTEVKLTLKRVGFWSSETKHVVLTRDDGPSEESAAGEAKRPESQPSSTERSPKKQARDEEVMGAAASAEEENAPSWSVLEMFDCMPCSAHTGSASIGVVLRQKGELVEVAEVLHGAVAQRTGKVLVNDVFLEIDGQSAAQSVDAVMRQLCGPKGSYAALKIRRPAMFGSEIVHSALLREQIVCKPAPGS